MKALIQRLLPVADLILPPLVYPAAWLLKQIRYAGVHRLPRCKRALLQVGVFPIRNHFYEPQFDHRDLRPDSSVRALSGIDWNIQGQLQQLDAFVFADELADVPLNPQDTFTFYLNNERFEAGDAEYWYQLIRAIKPRRIIEIGSGYSTLMTVKAVRRNQHDDPDYRCQHTCIEPYEMPWLEATGASVIRKKVEDVELSLFSQLDQNDILFIDSSHIIRPQGDVLFEYLEILPSLHEGVIVHVHDIFTPRNYPGQWIREEVRLWNEQYLLEAFLTHNRQWKIIGALNYLRRNHYERLKAVAPFLTPDREPGSFYIQRVAG
jgi:hypothetical protein